ncbi:MAG: mechanosensitive ion channel family protein [Conexibacter sp.]|nr:mechanosensitive ion channel family protein [Conexibacter sp.]
MRPRLRDTRGHQWLESGLARQLSRRAVKRARIQLLVLAPTVAAVLLVYNYRIQLFGSQWDTVVRAGTAIALVVLGWQVARDVGRSLGPILFRYLEPATAGTVGFLIRLATIVVAVVVALRIAKLDPQTIALSGAFTAVVVGLAAQQTLGNLIAGTVLVSARPFRVGERVRMQGGGLAGSVEGLVSSFGLLYTILARGEDSIMVPNSVVLSVAVVPLREPTGVDLRARLRPGATPADVQERPGADGADAAAVAAERDARGDRRRRGGRAHRSDPGAARRRPAAGDRGAPGDLADHRAHAGAVSAAAPPPPRYGA